MAAEMQRTFSERFMREFGEAGINRWKDDVAKAIAVSVTEVKRIKSVWKNVTVFLERDDG